MEIVNDLTNEHVQFWGEDAKVKCYAAPTGFEEDVASCNAVVSISANGYTGLYDDLEEIHIAWKPNEIELAHLAKGGTLWLTVLGGLNPHYLTVQEPS